MQLFVRKKYTVFGTNKVPRSVTPNISSSYSSAANIEYKVTAPRILIVIQLHREENFIYKGNCVFI